jgi:hypothetical protein
MVSGFPQTLRNHIQQAKILAEVFRSRLASALAGGLATLTSSVRQTGHVDQEHLRVNLDGARQDEETPRIGREFEGHPDFLHISEPRDGSESRSTSP